MMDVLSAGRHLAYCEAAVSETVTFMLTMTLWIMAAAEASEESAGKRGPMCMGLGILVISHHMYD